MSRSSPRLLYLPFAATPRRPVARLEAEGFEVTEANRTEAALDAVADQRFDAILLETPSVTSPEAGLREQLHRRWPAAGVLLLGPEDRRGRPSLRWLDTPGSARRGAKAKRLERALRLGRNSLWHGRQPP